MSSGYPKDLEDQPNAQEYITDGYENEPLIPSKETGHSPSKRQFSWIHILAAFLAGILVQFLVGSVTSGSLSPSPSDWSTFFASTNSNDNDFVPPYVGSTEVHHYPPTDPIGIDTGLFPTDVGYPGPTPTGAEPAVFLTAPSFPQHTGATNLLVSPKFFGAKTSLGKHFDLFSHWGNLSPWFSVPKSSFGVHSGPETPKTCRVTGLHFVHRHGARYPTGGGRSFCYRSHMLARLIIFIDSYGGPAKFATKIHGYGTKWNARGSLSFLNNWLVLLSPHSCIPLCSP